MKSFYAGGDTITESDMGLFLFKATGISDIAAKQVSNIAYYNLTGQRSNKPFSGMNIVVTTYTDGTTSAAKIIR